MLEIKNLTKVYDDGTVALKDVSFTVEPGEFLVIIGLSGSGKSTLLRCINRLIDPTEGQILWDGRDITAAEAEQLRQIRSDAYRCFFLSRLFRFVINPLHLIRKIHSREDLRYMLRLTKTGITILRKSFSRNTSRSLLWN